MYKRIRQVYLGPACDVYEGKLVDETSVALKVVDLDFVRKPHDFIREVKILRALTEWKNPHIVPFIDAYRAPGSEDEVLVMPFYKTDLVSLVQQNTKRKMKFNLADPSKNKLQDQNCLALDACRSIAFGLADALRFLHARHIIHRDVKPANVFITGENTPVLGDFGISYPVDDPPALEPWNEKVGDIATGWYKPPELCFGVTDYSHEVDLWLLGILVLYLYSKDGQPVNCDLDDDEREEMPELNDFLLLRGLFKSFGTPTVTDKLSPLYWGKMASEKYHFVKFKYAEHPRKLVEELLPRCRDPDVQALFSGLTRYDGRILVELTEKWSGSLEV